MATRTPLTDHLATRANSIDFTALGMWLPNPDPILKAQGKDITTYRDMRFDALIGSCIERRKASVAALDHGLDRGQASSRVAKAVQAMLDALTMDTLIEQMHDAVFYGYQPMEVIWDYVGGLNTPAQVLAKPPEWFCFDSDNALRLRTRGAPVTGALVPDKKFLLPRKSPTYQNPYGFASLSMCYWPLLFKKGGVKFWLAFTEKFGSAFLQGKLPRTATEAERAALLQDLEDMIQNGVAVIPDDGSIAPIEAQGKSASADLYAQLVAYCSSEIAIALLGQNMTTQANSNKASSVAGLEVTKDLRDGDAKIIAAAINELIRWFVDVNFGAVVAPVFSFWDQKEQDELQAKRDKSNYDAGARFTNAYWMRGYGYQEGDLQPEPTAKLPKPIGPAAFAEGSADPMQTEVDALQAAGQSAWDSLTNQLQALVDQATSTAELQRTLTDAYGGLETDQLVKLMAAAMALAELKGMDEARV